MVASLPLVSHLGWSKISGRQIMLQKETGTFMRLPCCRINSSLRHTHLLCFWTCHAGKPAGIILLFKTVSAMFSVVLM